MSNNDKWVSNLREIVGEANVIEDPGKLKALAVEGVIPKVLVSPGTIDETSQVVAYAYAEKLAVIPIGNGTKMGLGGIPKQADILLSTRRLNRYTDYDIANLTLGVECGVTLAEAQAKLAGEGKGYFLALDPPHTQNATLGGIVATNDSGPKRFLYGASRDIILGIKAVFPNGDIVVAGGKAVKNVAGYDITKMLIGSMGSLGIICGITFRITPRPDAEATLLVSFNGLKEAAGYLRKILHSKYYPASLELMNAGMAGSFGATAALKGKYAAAIALEGIEEAVARQNADLGEMGRQEGASEVITLKVDAHRDFWTAYRDFTAGLAQTHPNLISLKANFALSKVTEMVGAFEGAIREAGLDCALSCRAGNGILFAALPPGDDLGGKTAAVVGLIGRLTAESVKNGGNLIVERAPRTIKEKVSVWGQTRSDVVVVRRLKAKLDPSGILNPGRYVGGV
ncbi:MAG: FAD-binding oxidoreductase [Deltaproteobacteria bacterium]|nr:FAD-binding oxidoreductase [Deltaproteobacteria bacterium]